MSPAATLCPAPGCGLYRPCPEHPTPTSSRGRRHRTARAQTLLEERHCWICRQPGTTNDPLTADHIVPRSHGGPDTRTESAGE